MRAYILVGVLAYVITVLGFASLLAWAALLGQPVNHPLEDARVCLFAGLLTGVPVALTATAGLAYSRLGR